MRAALLLVLFSCACAPLPDEGGDGVVGAEGKVDDAAPPPPANGGLIVEDIPWRYRDRYRRWKSQFRAVPTGRALWDRYDTDHDFHLKVIVAGNDNDGGGQLLDDQFDAEGRLVGATMRLAPRLGESGELDEERYPLGDALQSRPDDRLAIADAARVVQVIAHELGHAEDGRALGTRCRAQHDAQLAWTDRVIALAQTGLSDEQVLADPEVVRLGAILGDEPTRFTIIRELRAERRSATQVADYFGSRIPDRVRAVIDSLQADVTLAAPQPGATP